MKCNFLIKIEKHLTGGVDFFLVFKRVVKRNAIRKLGEGVFEVVGRPSAKKAQNVGTTNLIYHFSNF